MGNELYHYGTPKHSGRYPWGSGEDPYHHGESAPSWWKNRKVRKDFKVYRKAGEQYAQDTKDAVSADSRARYRRKSVENLARSGSKFTATNTIMQTKYSNIEMESSIVMRSSGREFVDTMWKDKTTGEIIVSDSKKLKNFSGRRVVAGGTAAYKSKRRKEVAAGAIGLTGASAIVLGTLL